MVDGQKPRRSWVRLEGIASETWVRPDAVWAVDSDGGMTVVYAGMGIVRVRHTVAEVLALLGDGE